MESWVDIVSRHEQRVLGNAGKEKSAEEKPEYMWMTTEGRLSRKNSGDFCRLAETWLAVFGQLLRVAFQYQKHDPGLDQRQLSAYLQRRFDVSRACADSAVSQAAAKLRLARGQQAQRRKDAYVKIEAMRRQLPALRAQVNAAKKLAARNQLDGRGLAAYRRKKKELHDLSQRLDQYVGRVKRYEKELRTGNIPVCFGTERVFRMQHDLERYGFSNHGQWLEAFRARRDRSVLFSPRSALSFGNEMIHLVPVEDDRFLLELQDVRAGAGQRKDKYRSAVIRIPWLTDAVTWEAIVQMKSRFRSRIIVPRIVRRKHGLYFQVTVQQKIDPGHVTSFENGAVGIDFNYGFIQLAEAARDGSLVCVRRLDLPHQSRDRQGRPELLVAVRKIVNHCVRTRKVLVCEQLEYDRVRAASSEGHKLNFVTHRLNYGQYLEALKRRCLKDRVRLVMVNPAYTSRNALGYLQQDEMDVHTASALMIARRAMGLPEWRH